MYNFFFFMGRFNSVGIAIRYGLDGAGSDFPSGRAILARICYQLVAGVPGSNPAGGMDICVVCCRRISDMKTKDIKVHKV